MVSMVHKQYPLPLRYLAEYASTISYYIPDFMIRIVNAVKKATNTITVVV